MKNTKTCPRLQVDYRSLDELLADAQRLVDADAATTGNWSLGRILEHLTTVMNKSIDGFQSRAPLPMRLVARYLLKRRILTKKMAPGFQLPPGAVAEIVPDEIDSREALAHLRQVVDRLKRETGRAESPFLGPLDIEQWSQLHCRHGELHMSFVAEPQKAE